MLNQFGEMLSLFIDDKIYKNRYLIIYSASFILIVIYSLVIDVLINNNKWIFKAIEVSNNYISNIFASQFTIAALSGTLFTIIANSNTKRFGKSINEILHLDKKHLSLNCFIIMSLGSVLISAICLAINFTNTIFLLLSANIILVIIVGRQIYKSLFEMQYSYKVLDNSLKEGSNEKEIGASLFQSFEFEFENIINSNILEYYLLLLNQYVKKDYNIENKNTINEYLRRIILNSIETRDLKFSNYILDKIFEGTTNFSEYDRNPIIVSQYEKLSFYTSQKFIESHLPDFIKDFEDNDSLSEDIVEDILDTYFESLYKNDLLSEEYKARFIENYVNEMCHLYSQKDNITKIKERQLFRIVKYYAIEQKDINLFNRVISKLYTINNYSSDEAYYRILSQIFMLVYSYSFLEQEEISDNFREEIKRYLDTNPDSINKNKVTLKKIVVDNIGMIIKEISKNVINDEFYTSFEYRAEYTFVKTPVWSYETLTEILLYLYIVFYEFSGKFDFLSFITDIKNADLNKQKRILEKIRRRTEKFNEYYKFDNYVTIKIKELCHWFGMYSGLEESIANEIAGIVMPSIEERYEKVLVENSKNKSLEFANDEINIEKINSKLLELNSREKCSWFTNDLEGNAELFKELTFIKHIENENENEVAYLLKKYINRYLNESINETLAPVAFYFDEYGISTLCDSIKTYENINYSNYDVSRDWGISKEVREKKSFKKYLELKDNIEFTDELIIYQKFFMRKEDLKVRAKVISCFTYDLVDEEISDYAERFRSYGGVYRYEGSLINKSTLMTIIQNSYKKFRVTMKLKSDIKSDSGFRIEFRKMSIEMD